MDVRGDGKVRLRADAKIDIELGIDLSNPKAPRPFLYSGPTGTQAGVGVKVWAKDINFSASVLSFGVGIQNGFVAIDSDGVAESTFNPDDKLSYSVSLTDTDGLADGRVYFDSLTLGNLQQSPLAGQFHVNLPMSKKSDGSSIGALDWTFAISTLSGGGWSSAPSINSTPNFGSLLSGLDLSSQLDGFSGGLADFFSILDVAIENQALIAKLPLIGDALRDAVRFVGDIRDKITDNLAVFGPKSALIVQQKIYEALGPGGLNWLRDQNDANWRASTSNANVDVSDVALVQNSSTDVRYNVRLKQSLARVQVPVDFDIGLPLLGLDVDGQVQLELGFDWELTFGLDKSKGFYITTGVSDELRIALEATVPGFNATGTLGFLQVNVTDGTDLNGNNTIEANEKTRLVASMNVDIRDPGTGANNDNLLILSELTNAGAPTVIAASFPTANTNRADVRLHLVGAVGGSADFPEIHTDLTVGWAFGGSGTSESTSIFGDKPEVWLRNVQIDPGQVIERLAKPVLDRVNAVLGPVNQ